MQIPKTDIRQTIIKTARKEFMQHGFKDASMRRIARVSGVGLSNIYNYFTSKDEIFCFILAPLLNAFDKLEQNHNSEPYLTTEVFTMKSYQQAMINEFMVILKGHKEQLKLLFWGASGSSLENFRDTLINRHTKTGLEYMQLMKAKYPHIHSEVSPFFIHFISSWWVMLLGEIVSHDELTEMDIEIFLSEYVTFSTAGWKVLMKVP